MNKITKLLYFFGIVFMLATTLVFCWTFTLAYLNGYQITIVINDYNEAQLELWMMIFGLISMAVYIKKSWSELFLNIKCPR